MKLHVSQYAWYIVLINPPSFFPPAVKLELPYLLKKLDGCKATWFHFGIGLGLNDNNLRQIEKNQSNPGVLKCLHGTLKLWLNSEDPNLETLVKAIELSGYGRLASSIKSKYQGTKYSCIQVCECGRDYSYAVKFDAVNDCEF